MLDEERYQVIREELQRGENRLQVVMEQVNFLKSLREDIGRGMLTPFTARVWKGLTIGIKALRAEESRLKVLERNSQALSKPPRS